MEDLQLNLFFIEFLLHTLCEIVNSGQDHIELDVPSSLKECHDICDHTESVIRIKISKVIAPSDQHIVSFIGLCHLIHALHILLGKGLI
jgi:hypothetical protein